MPLTTQRFLLLQPVGLDRRGALIAIVYEALRARGEPTPGQDVPLAASGPLECQRSAVGKRRQAKSLSQHFGEWTKRR
jgi:hypothetical protein